MLGKLREVFEDVGDGEKELCLYHQYSNFETCRGLRLRYVSVPRFKCKRREWGQGYDKKDDKL